MDGRAPSRPSPDAPRREPAESPSASLPPSPTDSSPTNDAPDAQLRDGDARYRALFEAMDDGFCVIEVQFDAHDRPVDYRFLELNPAFERHTGLRGAVGRRARDMVPNLEAFWFETYGKVARTGEPIRFQHSAPSMDRHFDVYAFSIGRVEHCRVAILFRDVTQQVQADAQRRDGEETLRFALDVSRMGAWDLDLETYTVQRSAEYDRIFGYEVVQAEWTYAKSLEHIVPEDRPIVDRAFQQAMAAGTAWSVECRIRRPDGAVRWIWVAGRPKQDASGAVRRMTGIVQDITARKSADERLVRSRDAFFNLMQEAPFGVYVVDREFRIHQVNAGAQKAFVNVRPLIGRDFNEALRILWPEPFVGEALAQFRRTLETGEPYIAPSLTNRRLDVDSVESYEWQIHRITLPDGHFGVVCYFYESTEIRRAELLANERELQLRFVTDHAPVLIAHCDHRERYKFVNRPYAAWRDLVPSDCLGKTMAEVLGPTVYATLLPHIRTVLSGLTAEFDVDLPRPSGGLRHKHGVLVPECGPSGEVVGFVTVLLDVTARRRAEDTLRRREAQWRMITDAVPTLISYVDETECYRSANATYERVFHRSREVILGRTMAELWGGCYASIQPYVARALGGETVRFETVLTVDGGSTDLLMSFTPDVKADGRIDGLYVLATDITERKRQEDELRRWKDVLEVRVQQRTRELSSSQERLRALAAQLSVAEERARRKVARDLHDYLAQLLVVSRMKMGQVTRVAGLPPQSAGMLADVDGLLEQALTYTRHLIAELAPPSLQQYGFVFALRWLGERFAKDGLQVTVEADCEHVPLPEEQGVVAFQWVRELLFNVLKHAAVDRADVRVTVVPNRSVQLTVSDRGTGLDADALHRAAEPGHLGLFSVREQVEALGGRLDIHSAPQQGTAVTILVPLAPGPASAGASDPHHGAAGPSSRPTPDSTSIRVLLVDDHLMVRQGLKSILQEYPRLVVVGEAGDGEAAVVEADRLVPDVVLMDINMPKLNGIEATKRIILRHPYIVVIALSVEVNDQACAAAAQAGARAFLSKDSHADRLYEAILKGVEATSAT